MTFITIKVTQNKAQKYYDMVSATKVFVFEHFIVTFGLLLL